MNNILNFSPLSSTRLEIWKELTLCCRTYICGDVFCRNESDPVSSSDAPLSSFLTQFGHCADEVVESGIATGESLGQDMSSSVL
jgi:hypothetical protein